MRIVFHMPKHNLETSTLSFLPPFHPLNLSSLRSYLLRMNQLHLSQRHILNLALLKSLPHLPLILYLVVLKVKNIDMPDTMITILSLHQLMPIILQVVAILYL